MTVTNVQLNQHTQDYSRHLVLMLPLPALINMMVYGFLEGNSLQPIVNYVAHLYSLRRNHTECLANHLLKANFFLRGACIESC